MLLSRRRMKILLVFPRIEHGQITANDKGKVSQMIFGNPIITLPHIATITPKNHDIKIVDENYQDINFNEDADLVGITCYTMTAPRVYKIADEFRKRGKKVILGGYHPTAIPQEAKQHADSIVMGMAEASWPKLLNDLEKGKLKELYDEDEDFDMSKIPQIDGMPDEIKNLLFENPETEFVQLEVFVNMA